ncbi:hypothetical protein FGC33_04200, partial [Streptococcus pyogenes]
MVLDRHRSGGAALAAPDHHRSDTGLHLEGETDDSHSHNPCGELAAQSGGRRFHLRPRAGRTHVDDIAQVLAASIARPNP